jgi:hypothetical protein
MTAMHHPVFDMANGRRIGMVDNRLLVTWPVFMAMMFVMFVMSVMGVMGVMAVMMASVDDSANQAGAQPHGGAGGDCPHLGFKAVLKMVAARVGSRRTHGDHNDGNCVHNQYFPHCSFLLAFSDPFSWYVRFTFLLPFRIWYMRR